MDGNILLWIQDNLRNNVLDVIMKTITRLGDGGLIWIVIAIILLLFKKYRYAGLASAISLILTLLTVNICIKNVVARIRPYEVIEGLTRIVSEQSDYSFPSGHTAHSFAVGIVVFIMLPKCFGIPTLCLSVLMGLSRLYVGVHYPTDVLGGAIIGTIMALISVFIVGKIRNKFSGKENDISESEALNGDEEKDISE